MANNQEKSQELIIFYKKNNILYLFLRNLEIFITFAGNVQYNALLGMEVKYEDSRSCRQAICILQ